jgi:hypothetical protein
MLALQTQDDFTMAMHTCVSIEERAGVRFNLIGEIASGLQNLQTWHGSIYVFILDPHLE